jgi:hypothetical protein
MRKYLFILLALAASNSVRAEDLDRERLLTQAAPGWESYRSFVKRLQGRVSGTIDAKLLNRTIHERIDVRWSNTGASYIGYWPEASSSGKKMAKSWANVANSRYGFRLQRDDPDGAWSLTSLVPAAQVKHMSPFPPAWAVMHQCFEEAIHFVSELDRLPDFCAAPGFRLHKLSEVAEDGETLLRVDFSSAGGFVKVVTIDGLHRNGHQGVRGGHFFLDPQACYTIRAFELQCDEPQLPRYTLSGRIEYRRSADGFPILVKKVSEGRAPADAGGRVLSRSVREYDLKEEPPPAESAFTLSAFGLPEPAEYRRPTPWYWYLAAGGIVALIGGAVLRRRWRNL